MKLSSAALVAFAAPVIAQQTTNTYATTTITSMHTVTATLTCEPSDYVTSTRTLIEYEDDRCIVNNFVYSHCKFLPLLPLVPRVPDLGHKDHGNGVGVFYLDH